MAAGLVFKPLDSWRTMKRRGKLCEEKTSNSVCRIAGALQTDEQSSCAIPSETVLASECDPVLAPMSAGEGGAPLPMAPSDQSRSVGCGVADTLNEMSRHCPMHTLVTRPRWTDWPRGHCAKASSREARAGRDPTGATNVNLQQWAVGSRSERWAGASPWESWSSAANAEMTRIYWLTARAQASYFTQVVEVIDRFPGWRQVPEQAYKEGSKTLVCSVKFQRHQLSATAVQFRMTHFIMSILMGPKLRSTKERWTISPSWLALPSLTFFCAALNIHLPLASCRQSWRDARRIGRRSCKDISSCIALTGSRSTCA